MKYSFITKNLFNENIVVAKAKGVWLWDIHNKKYLDCSSQTLNLNLGNSPDFIKNAFLTQFEKFSYLSTRFENPILIELSKKVTELAPSGLTKINLKLTNGSDANESAFKRVRIFRKKQQIVTFYWSHLGEGCETISAAGKYFYSISMGGSDRFLHVYPPFYFKERGLSEKESDDRTLQEIEFLFRHRDDIAAFILEPIMVNAGGYILSKYLLKQIRSLCNKYRISLIFDEVQTAFGWLGTFFAADYYGVVPDLLTIAKGLGFGFPIAGILMRDEYDVLDYGTDEYTNGGHPISCAVALAGIKYLEKKRILQSIPRKEQVLKNSLNDISTKFKQYNIKEVRVCGLIAGIEFKSNQFAVKVYNKALKNCLILRKSRDGKGTSLVIKPPLIITVKEIEKAAQILRQSIEQCI